MAGRAAGVRTGVGVAFFHVGLLALADVQTVQAVAAASGRNSTAGADTFTFARVTTTPPCDVVDTTMRCVVAIVNVLFCWMAMRTGVVSGGSDPAAAVDFAGSTGTPAEVGPEAAAIGGIATTAHEIATPARSAPRRARGGALWLARRE